MNIIFSKEIGTDKQPERNGWPKLWRHAFQGALAAALLMGFLLAVTAADQSSGMFTTASAWQNKFRLQGRVFEEKPGGERNPLEGATVSLFGSNDAYPSKGTFLTSAVTNKRGLYELEVGREDANWEFLHIIPNNMEGYVSVKANSVGGAVRTAGWIEFAGPLEGKDLTGNTFWIRNLEGKETTPKAKPQTLTPIEGWCCKDGDVFAATITQCNNQGGRFFKTREEAEAFCRERGQEPERGFCCLDGRIFPAGIDECRERGGRFFHTMEEAEEHCRGDQPREGWCCLDGDVFPSTEAACLERGGHFFRTREAAEELCHDMRLEHARGYCCLEGEIFPASIEECEERRGRFFRTLEEAEEFCRGDRPREGWCCLDGDVFPSTEAACLERGGRFFPTIEEAEEFCRKEQPSEGWCCRDGEVFPAASEACCRELGGIFFPIREQAEEFCRGKTPGPDMRPYPGVPTANLDVEGLVPLDTLEKVANAQAHEIWGEEIAQGPPFPVADREGNVFAYVFHYMRGSKKFPRYEQIFDEVRRRRQDPQLTQMGEKFGYIYVSATDRNFPILAASHYLHPYFLVGDIAQEQANHHFDNNEVRLDKIYFLDPHDVYFEFISQGKSILFNLNSLEKKDTEAALDVAPPSVKTNPHRRKIQEAWERAIQSKPIGTPAEDAAIAHTEKRILHWKRLPIIPHTWWCVPTTQAHILGFWDNYAKGSGTFLGYGRFIKYWFEHDTQCHLPTGRDVDCKLSGAIHNNVPDIIDVIIDPKTGSWRKGYNSLTDFVSKLYGYKFSSGKVVPSAANDWAWKDVKKEVDNGRPAFWSFNAHMVASIGYRITNSGQKLVITYDSYGITFTQKIIEYAYDMCNGFQWVVPGGGSNGDHMIIDSPEGGENLMKMVPYDITWWVWGAKIAKTSISFSGDSGKTWNTIASDIKTKVGKNSYQWLPDKATTKGRIRVECYTDQKELIAADGCRKDFAIEAALLNNWSSWKSLGKPLTGQYGIERLAVGQNQDGRLEVIGIGSDGALWHNYQTTPNSFTWNGWANMGKPSGSLLSSAAVGRNQDGRLELIAVASDGALWHRYQVKPNKGPWVQWSKKGKPPGGVKLVANPVIGQNQDGRLEVFVFGSDGALWHTYQAKPSAGPWSSWTSLGKPSSSENFFAHPAVAINKDGRLEVFAMAGKSGKGEFQSSDTAVWHKSQSNPNDKYSWDSWQSLGKPLGASWPSPAVAKNMDGRLEVFVPGSDGSLWHRGQNQPNSGSWNPWKDRESPPGGIKVLSQIDVAANKDGRLEVFTFGIRGKGPSSVIAPWHIWQISAIGGWSKWAGLGAPPGKDFKSLCVGKNKDGRLAVFAIATDDNSVWHIQQK